MRKHTSGEWSVLNHLGVFVIADGGLTVAKITYQLPDENGESERLANASLMASSPDLLEALEALLNLPAAKEELRMLDRGIGTATENKAWLSARSAIARAKGEAE